MIRALIWKEWRTQRSLVLAGLAIAALLPLFLMAGAMATSSRYRFGDLVAALPPVLVMFVWPLFAAATGATAFAADRSDDSLRFLLSRPVSRGRVWLIKAGSGMAAFLAVVAGTMLIGALYTRLSGGVSVGFSETIARQLGGRVDDALTVGAPFVLLFGCSLYCSTFARRPIAAAAAGFVIAAVMMGAAWATWWLVLPTSARLIGSFSNAFYGLRAMAGVPLAAIGVLVAAFLAFRRGDVLVETGRKSALRPLLIVALAAAVFTAVPSAYGGMRTMASFAASLQGDLAPAADVAMVTELTPGGLSTRITALPFAGDASREILVGHATHPVASLDGRWIVYVSHGRYLGLLAEEAQVRAVRPDGTDDHAISAVLDWDWGYSPFSLLVAPDNDHVAWVTPSRVMIGSISRGEAREIDLGITENIGVVARNGDVIGWAAGEPAELLFSRVSNRFNLTPPRDGGSPVEWGPALHRTELLAFDPESGETRTVAELPGEQRLRIYSRILSSGTLPQRAWSWLPGWIEDADVRKLVLIDTAGGEIVELTRTPCDLWGFSEDGGRFVYASCSGQLRTGDAHAEIRVLDLASRSDEIFAVLEGYDVGSTLREVFLSPEEERLLLYARHGYGGPRGTYLVSRDAQVRALAEGMVPARWIGRDEALVARRTHELRLGIVDVRTGAMRTIYP